MTASDYIKRIIEELSGRKPKRMPSMPASFINVTAGLIGVLVVLVFFLLFYEAKNDVSAECAFYITEAGVPTPVTVGDAAQLDVCLSYETVASHSSRALGLSGRESLPRDRGMLFDFEKPAKYCMWMKDMRFSLDMLWINGRKEIVAIREDVSPDTYPNSFCGPETARYVLEVNAGIVEAGDLRIGQRLRL